MEAFMADKDINGARLEEELCNNPSKLGYYISQAALWNVQVDRCKQQRDTRASQVWADMKNSGEKTTDKFIEASIKLDKEYQDICRTLHLAREQHLLYEGAVTTLEKKQYSLGSLNAMNRSELDATHAVSPTRSTPEERAERRSRFGNSESNMV